MIRLRSVLVICCLEMISLYMAIKLVSSIQLWSINQIAFDIALSIDSFEFEFLYIMLSFSWIEPNRLVIKSKIIERPLDAEVLTFPIISSTANWCVIHRKGSRTILSFNNMVIYFNYCKLNNHVENPFNTSLNGKILNNKNESYFVL